MLLLYTIDSHIEYIFSWLYTLCIKQKAFTFKGGVCPKIKSLMQQIETFHHISPLYKKFISDLGLTFGDLCDLGWPQNMLKWRFLQGIWGTHLSSPRPQYSILTDFKWSHMTYSLYNNYFQLSCLYKIYFFTINYEKF